MTIDPPPVIEPGTRRPPSKSEQGAVVIWSLGLILLLFFAGGLALDLWRVLSQHGTLTGIADKAAIAAANKLDQNALFQNRLMLDHAEAKRTAVRFAEAQPEWTKDTMTVKATVEDYTDREDCTDREDRTDRSVVRVEVSGEVQLTLLRLFAPPQGITVTVNSRASPERVRIARPAISEFELEIVKEEPCIKG